MEIGPGALFAIFLILRLTNVIHWSWWWITAPLWGGVMIAIAATAGIFAAFRKEFR